MEYNNVFLNPQSKYFWRRLSLVLILGIPACLLFLKGLGLFIRIMWALGVY